ncbi:pectate lyase [Prochlorococcus marinus str. MU1402]|uniref:pectate lyase n=1 Tax=Prochlorococcus marinus TaxID=1219 RepID=UPI001ADD3138|nr:pectate lyase [Prochlorococcus marinus]MBO8232560.1 pectate lyase [Prochlorococcus marinus XMU1402]MBW3057281.1 pectate lyase [Prochlorococcus marinus str. MU1402]
MSEIKTPWGSISSKVSLFPIYYLIFIYGFVYILPFGKNLFGTTWFDLLKKEDGPLEWLQFSQFFISSLMGLFIYYKSKKKRSIDALIWLFFSIFCFLISAEEISWGERITGFSLNSISELSIQGETNFHNLPFFHNILLDPLLHVLCIFFGWVGWRKWPNLNSLPSKKYSLFFLFVSLFFAYYDISWASTVEHIRNDQEIFEFLLSTGIFLHFWGEFKIIKNH